TKPHHFGKKLGQFINLVMTWKISLKWDGFYVILRISYNKPEFNISLWEYSIQHCETSVKRSKKDMKEYGNLFVEHIVCQKNVINYSLIVLFLGLRNDVILTMEVFTLCGNKCVNEKFCSINISTMFFFARAEVISVIFLIFIKIYIAQELQYYCISFEGNLCVFLFSSCLTLNKHTHIIHKYRYSAGTNGAYGFEEILEKERKDMHSIMNQIFLDKKMNESRTDGEGAEATYMYTDSGVAHRGEEELLDAGMRWLKEVNNNYFTLNKDLITICIGWKKKTLFVI
ncbi:hypothetical protein ACJX0J_008246, partial [Zea mays]